MRIVRVVGRMLLLGLVFAVPVWAAEQPQAPIELCGPGVFCAPTALTEPGGANPIVAGDLPNETTAGFFGRISDETTAPFLGALNLFASGILLGDGTKLATSTTAGASGNLVKWGAGGALIDGGAPTSGTAAIFNFESQFPIPAGDLTTFVSAGGNISATSAQSQSLAVENMTLGSPCCFVYTAEPGTAMVVTLNSGTYGGALTPSSVTVTLLDADTPVCDSSNSLAITAGQGYNVDVNGDSGTAEGQLRGGCKRTA